MSWLNQLWRAKHRDRELSEEIRRHIEEKADELEASGTSREEARYQARREFGNVGLAEEDSRAEWRWPTLENLLLDLRYGLRQLAKNPSFTAVAVLTLALGIGANTAIFSVVDAILLRPLPYPEPERLVKVWEWQLRTDNEQNVVNPFNFLDWKEQSQSFETMAAYTGTTANLSFQGEPTAVASMEVTPDFFTVLRVTPFLGRTFNATDGVPKQDHSIILSYGLWKERFGGDSAVVGKKIEVNGEPSEVIGVMRPDFTYPNSKAAAWMPMALARTEEFKRGRFMAVVARLKTGISLEQARQDMLRVASYTQKARPDMDKNWSATVYPMLEDATRDVRKPLWVLLAAVGFLLLIGCANVANLLLMRGTGRMREMAVRSALGAARSRIVEQLLIESVLLALAGMAAGVFLAYFGLQGLLALIPKAAPLPRGNVAIDGKVLLFTFVCSVLTAILFGVVPALRLSHVELQDALRQGSVRTGGGGHQTLRRCFVVAEVSLALMLSVGAGLMLRSFAKLIAVDPGFHREQILTMNMFTSPARYSDNAKRSQYFTRLLGEIRSTPGVDAAGSTHFLPLTNMTSGSCFSRADGPEPTPAEAPSAQFLIISPGYFRTMGTTVLRGRDFADSDTFESQPVAMVNDAFAERYFAKEDILGKQLRVCWTVKKPVEIVGVAANARQAELQDSPEPTIFLSNAQVPMYFATLVARATGDPSSITRSVEEAIHRVDPDQALSDVRTMDAVFSDSVSSPRLQAVLLLVFSGLAIALAMIGVYGVVSYSVSQRTNEIGIRIAMGAASDKIFGLVLREALILAAAALAIGLGGAVMLSRVLQTLLFEVAPTDPVSMTAAGLIVLAVSALAALLPAWRAMRVDPIVALRYE